eukprot:3260842-Amphidinium_carterae.2
MSARLDTLGCAASTMSRSLFATQHCCPELLVPEDCVISQAWLRVPVFRSFGYFRFFATRLLSRRVHSEPESQTAHSSAVLLFLCCHGVSCNQFSVELSSMELSMDCLSFFYMLEDTECILHVPIVSVYTQPLDLVDTNGNLVLKAFAQTPQSGTKRITLQTASGGR